MSCSGHLDNEDAEESDAYGGGGQRRHRLQRRVDGWGFRVLLQKALRWIGANGCVGFTCRAESRRRPIAAGNMREMAEVTPMVATAMLGGC